MVASCEMPSMAHKKQKILKYKVSPIPFPKKVDAELKFRKLTKFNCETH